MKKTANSVSDKVFALSDVKALDAFLNSRNVNISGTDYVAIKRLRSAIKVLTDLKFPVTMSGDGVYGKTAYGNLMKSLENMIKPGSEEYNYSTAFNTYKNVSNLFEVQRRVINALREVYRDETIALSTKQRDAINEFAGRLADDMFSEYSALCGVSETFNWELLTEAQKSALSGKSREEAAAEVEKLTMSSGLKHLPLTFDYQSTNPLTGRKKVKTYFIPDLGKTDKGMALFLTYVNGYAKTNAAAMKDNGDKLDVFFKRMGVTTLASRVVGGCEDVTRRKKLLQARNDYFNSKIDELKKNPKGRVNGKYADRLMDEVINTPSYLDFFAPNGEADTDAKRIAAMHGFANGGYGKTYGAAVDVKDANGKVKYTANLRLSGVRTYEDWLKTPSGMLNQRALKNGIHGGIEIRNEEDYLRLVNSDNFVEYVQSLEVGIAAKKDSNTPDGYYFDKKTNRYYATEVVMCSKKNFDNLSYLLQPYDAKGKKGSEHKFGSGAVATMTFDGIPEGSDGSPMFAFERSATDVPMGIVRFAAFLGAFGIILPYGLAAKSMMDDLVNAYKNRPTPPKPTPSETTGEDNTSGEEPTSPTTPDETTKTPDETTGNNNPAKTDTPDDTTTTPDTTNKGGDVTRPAPDDTKKPSTPDTKSPETAPAPVTRGEETTKTPSGEVTRDNHRPSGADKNAPESGASPVDRPNRTPETTTELPPSRPDTSTSGSGSGNNSGNPAKDMGGRDSGTITTPGTEYMPGRSDNNSPSSKNTEYKPSGSESGSAGGGTNRPSGGNNQGSGKDNSAPDKAPGLTGDRTNNTSSSGSTDTTGKASSGNSVIDWIRNAFKGFGKTNPEDTNENS